MRRARKWGYPLIASLATERSERLARLALELLDVHADTQRLADGRANQVQWRTRLSYLRDLYRAAREIVADSIQ